MPLRLKTTCAPNPRIAPLVEGLVTVPNVEFDWDLKPVPMLFLKVSGACWSRPHTFARPAITGDSNRSAVRSVRFSLASVETGFGSGQQTFSI